MIPELAGRRVRLVPMRLEEADLLVRWANAQPGRWFAGTATRQEVLARWPPELFDDAFPQKGRVFRIEVSGQALGAVLHGSIWGSPRQSVFELLLTADAGADVGADAIDALARWVFDALAVRRLWAEVPPSDARGLRALEEAGFARQKTTAEGLVALARERAGR